MNKKKIIVCYIPKSSSNWIIEYLFIDISKASVNKEVEYVICKNLINLFLFNLNTNCKIICLHQNFIKRLKFIRINLKKISVFYTHTKIEYTHIKLLKEIKHLFVMNSTEINNLKVFGLEEKLELFTTGYDEKLFNRKDKERDIDFLFVCKFVDKDKQYYYWNRKNMDLLVNLAEKLRQKGIKFW